MKHLVVALVALASLALWWVASPALERATCPAPVRAAGQLVSCTGRATVSLLDGRPAVIAATSPPATAAHPRR